MATAQSAGTVATLMRIARQCGWKVIGDTKLATVYRDNDATVHIEGWSDGRFNGAHVRSAGDDDGYYGDFLSLAEFLSD